MEAVPSNLRSLSTVVAERLSAADPILEHIYANYSFEKLAKDAGFITPKKNAEGKPIEGSVDDDLIPLDALTNLYMASGQSTVIHHMMKAVSEFYMKSFGNPPEKRSVAEFVESIDQVVKDMQARQEKIDFPLDGLINTLQGCSDLCRAYEAKQADVASEVSSRGV